jgi:glycosyltransferase involved in cell wall biosynthesis
MTQKKFTPLKSMRIGIVIPTMNSGRYVQTVMESVKTASRQGANIAVHFQDGGSRDDTMRHIEEWARKMKSASAVRVSIESSEDTGVPEALNRSFQRLDADLLTWIGSDDIFFSHTFDTVLSFFDYFPHHHWLTGLTTQIDENGSFLYLGKNGNLHRPTAGFSRRQLVSGRHGSRMWGFVQQEGTFWTAAAWADSGGFIDSSLNAAFDFELWCRMAERYQLVQINKPLAAFRKHSGQISSDRNLYSQEVRAIRKRRLLSGGQVSTEVAGSPNERLLVEEAPGGWAMRSLPGRAFIQERISAAGSLIFGRKMLGR